MFSYIFYLFYFGHVTLEILPQMIGFGLELELPAAGESVLVPIGGMHVRFPPEL